MDKHVQSAALFEAVLEAAVDVIIVSDDTGTILQANPAAAAMFGYDVAALIGENVNTLMPKEMAAQHSGFMARFLETGERRIIGSGRDVEGVRRDGTVFPLHLSVGVSEAQAKKLFVAILHDLTDRQAAQDALARSQRLDAIGQMTGGIAHDFNNLLTVVIGNLELLEMRGADERQLALIKDALSSAELGAELTSRLMVFARKSDLKPVKVDLRVLCEDTLAVLHRTMGAMYRIRTDFADDVAPVMIDPVQLQSALMNLAFNARDAMGEKGEMVFAINNVIIDDTYLAQETDISPGRYVRVSVSDNGTGMSEEAQKRAFEPFFTTKGESGGTGLGLAMVYGFVRQSGGHITLYSEEGLGTSFGLYFPVAGTIATPNEQSVSHQQSGVRSGRGETVLVVEDNPKVRRLSLERIQDLGYNTLEAESGDAAYDMLKGGLEVDLVFTDLVMPGGLNGYDLAAKVHTEFPKIKVLVTSGYASDVVTSQLPRDRSYDILHKPYRQKDLAVRLQALLAGTGDT